MRPCVPPHISTYIDVYPYIALRPPNTNKPNHALRPQVRLLLHAYSRKEAVARAMMQWDVALGRKHAQSLLEQFTARTAPRQRRRRCKSGTPPKKAGHCRIVFSFHL